MASKLAGKSSNLIQPAYCDLQRNMEQKTPWMTVCPIKWGNFTCLEPDGY